MHTIEKILTETNWHTFDAAKCTLYGTYMSLNVEFELRLGMEGFVYFTQYFNGISWNADELTPELRYLYQEAIDKAIENTETCKQNDRMHIKKILSI